MKKILLILMCCVMFSGCSQISKFSYDNEIAILQQNLNIHSSSFANSVLSTSLSDKSTSYQKLVNVVLQNCSYEITYHNQTAIKLNVSYFNPEDLIQLAVQDIGGFQHDLDNLKQLNMSDAVINDYICDYLSIASLRCNKQVRELNCELTQCNSAPFLILSDDFIVNSVITDLNSVIAQLMNLDIDVPLNNSIVTRDDVKTLELNKVYLMNYSDSTNVIPISFEIKEIYKGQDAINYLENLSNNNKGLVNLNDILISYEVTNYGDMDVVFKNKLFDASLDDFTYYTYSSVYSGICNECNLSKGSSIVLSVVIKDVHNDLVWYDADIGELYRLNTN